MFGHSDDEDQDDDKQQTKTVAPDTLDDDMAEDLSNDVTGGSGSADPLPQNDSNDSPDAAATAPTVVPVQASTDIGSGTSDDLSDLKLQALKQLSPLVDQLEQTSEEKFKTIMMLIRASDDKTLVQAAFEAAKQITDDKARAQALLDVINEINYFTQKQDSSTQ